MTLSLYLFVLLYGLALGSFFNVVIYRLPLMLKAEWAEYSNSLLNYTTPKAQTFNLWLPHSHCTHCKTPIKIWQNIPLLSYILLKGRCNHCKSPISLRYPVIEFLTGVLFAYAVYHFEFTWTGLFSLSFISILICLFFIDLDTQLLPDVLTLSLLWLGLIANTQALFTPLEDAVLAAAVAYTALWLFIKLYYLLTGKIGMGHGDFKLFAAFGAWFGFALLPFILLFSCITGAILGTFYLRYTKKASDSPLPFGPFLCVSGFIALFWGNTLITWYLKGFF